VSIWEKILDRRYWLFFFYEKVGLIFVPSFYFQTESFFVIGWKDSKSENFGKKITPTKISFIKKLFPIENFFFNSKRSGHKNFAPEQHRNRGSE
jgi:hypothetical protein